MDFPSKDIKSILVPPWQIMTSWKLKLVPDVSEPVACACFQLCRRSANSSAAVLAAEEALLKAVAAKISATASGDGLFLWGYPWVAQIGWFTMEKTQTDPKMDEQECPQFSMETYGKLHMVMERPFAVPNWTNATTGLLQMLIVLRNPSKESGPAVSGWLVRVMSWKPY